MLVEYIRQWCYFWWITSIWRSKCGCYWFGSRILKTSQVRAFSLSDYRQAHDCILYKDTRRGYGYVINSYYNAGTELNNNMGVGYWILKHQSDHTISSTIIKSYLLCRLVFPFWFHKCFQFCNLYFFFTLLFVPYSHSFIILNYRKIVWRDSQCHMVAHTVITF